MQCRAPRLFTYFPNGSALQLCAGSNDSISINIGRNSTFSFNPGNQLEIQLSDASGKFDNPTILQTISSQISGGGSTPNISVKLAIPTSISSGLHYRIRAVSSDPATVSSGTGSDLAIISNQNQVFYQNGLLIAPYVVANINGERTTKLWQALYYSPSMLQSLATIHAWFPRGIVCNKPTIL